MNKLPKLFADRPVYVCDVEQQTQIDTLAQTLKNDFDGFYGFVHSIAFADYSDGMHPFHETNAQAVSSSHRYQLLFIHRSRWSPHKDQLDKQGSVVTISISTHAWPAKVTATWHQSKPRWIPR